MDFNLLIPSTEIRILEGKDDVDLAIITRVVEKEDGGGPKVVRVKSITLYPGAESDFCLDPGGSDKWRLLFNGLAGERCYSSRGPLYSFELAQ
jgi:hypothetical protein